VIDVNTDLYRPNGSKLTDIDIELDTIVIQVKSGSGAKITRQLINTSTGTDKIVIAYLPDRTPTSHVVLGALREGYNVFTDLESLLAFIGAH